MTKQGGTARGAPKWMLAVAAVLIAAAIAAGGVLIWLVLRTDGFSREYYVAHGGSVYTAEARQVVLDSGESQSFTVGRLLPSADGEIGYEVTVTPNAEENFTFTADGNAMAYRSIGDLTEYFGIVMAEEVFTVNIPEEFTMQQLLEQVYEGSEIEVPELKEADYFLLKVTFSNGEETEIYFRIYAEAEGITLDPPHIIF